MMGLADLRYAWRLFAARPALTFAAISTLALGLGANTAMFSVVRAVLLRPLPYEDPDRLVRLTGFNRRTGEPGNLSPADFLDVSRDAKTLAAAGAFGYIGFLTLIDGGDSERVGGVNVTAGFFPALGARFALGRAFTPDEDRPGAPRAVILSHAFWQRRYGGDPSVLGRSVLVNHQQATIVGVLDELHRHVEINAEREADLFVAFRFDPATAPRSGRFIRAIARLAPGATVDAARAELTAIVARLEQEHPRDNADQSIVVEPLQEAMVRATRPVLLMLTGAVGFVLLAACANLANLLLAHGASRRAEMAVRVALGASRARLARQLFIETLALAVTGAAAGLLLAVAATPVLRRLRSLGVPGATEVGIDWTVLLFVTVLALGTGIVIGLLPALQLSRGSVHAAVSGGGRGQTRRFLRRPAREALIAAQIALALVLLTGAGLMLRSLWQLQRVETGFRPANVLTFETAVPTALYEEGEQIPFYERFYERIRTLPGVVAVGGINILPLSANYDSRGVQIESNPAPPGRSPSIQARSVSPDYFRAMGIPLLEGRFFDERDREGSPLVVIISESMARRFWPDGRALGERITFNAGIPQDQLQEVGGPGSREIVGIVADVKHLALDEEDVPIFYTPQAQQPSYHTMALAVRVAGDAGLLAPAIREELRALDRNVPLYRVRTLDDVLGHVTIVPRVQGWLLSLLALLAVLLSAVGVYGVVGYVVGQRSQEIAVRLALGARQRTVLTSIFREGLRPVAAGLLLGTLGAIVTSRLVAGMLFQVSPTDVPTYLAVIGMLIVVSCGAIVLPARRAAAVNPAEALRAE